MRIPTGFFLLCYPVLVSCAGTHSETEPLAERNYLTAAPAITSDGQINVVIEIPAGTNAKWEVTKETGRLEWEYKDGKPRVVQYLSYPGNYGMIPQTALPKELGGDGDPLDVLVLGAALPRGAILACRPIGVLRMQDDGERDDKILAVPASGPLSDVLDIKGLGRALRGSENDRGNLVHELQGSRTNRSSRGRRGRRSAIGDSGGGSILRGAVQEVSPQEGPNAPARRSRNQSASTPATRHGMIVFHSAAGDTVGTEDVARGVLDGTTTPGR